MILELLKENGIEEAKANEIVEAMNNKKIYTTTIENVDVRYNKLQEQKKELDKIVKANQEQLEVLSKNNQSNDELTKQIEQLQLSNKQTQTDYEAKIHKMEFDYALDGALSNAKCKNSKALKALLDFDNINYQEGKINGLEDQLNALKQDCGYLFEDEMPQSTGNIGSFARGGGKSTVTKEQFRGMSYTERMDLYNTNKELFKTLSE